MSEEFNDHEQALQQLNVDCCDNLSEKKKVIKGKMAELMDGLDLRQQIQSLTKQVEELQSQLTLTNNVPYREAYQRGADSRDREVDKLKNQLTETQARNEELRLIVEAVAHIGNDFGYGESQLSEWHIEQAQKALSNNPDVEAYRLKEVVVKELLRVNYEELPIRLRADRGRYKAHLDTQAKQGKEGL